MARGYISLDGRAIAPRKPAHRPDFHQLETFLTVSETRSFAEAARQLGVSQPAVSQTIAKLEALYGGDLFERRRGAPVALTPIGRAILPKAKLLLFTVDHQIDHAIATAQSLTGSLSIGFYPGLAFGPLNAGIGEFHQTRPKVQLRLVETSPRELHRQLNERLLDIMFSAFVPDIAGGTNIQERLWDEPLVIALPDASPLAGKRELSWEDVRSLSIILRAPQGDLSTYHAIAARMADRPFKCDLHDVSRGALIEMVRLGFGATILFESAVTPREGITFRPVVDDNSSASIHAIWPKDDRNPLRHRLLSCVRKHSVM